MVEVRSITHLLAAASLLEPAPSVGRIQSTRDGFSQAASQDFKGAIVAPAHQNVKVRRFRGDGMKSESAHAGGYYAFLYGKLLNDFFEDG